MWRLDPANPHIVHSFRAIAWFPSSLAKARAPGVVAVRGTGPREIGIDNASTELVKAWERLGMTVSSVTARTYGKIGFAVAKVTLPVRRSKLAAPLVLGVVLIDDNGTWRWASLDFSSSNLARD